MKNKAINKEPLDSPSKVPSGTLSHIRVRYSETDAQGIVYHGQFFTYFEVGRLDLLLSIVGNAEHAGKIWEKLAIVSAQCDYKRAIQFPDIIDVETRVTKVGKTSFQFGYRIHNSERNLVAEGQTTLVYTNRNNVPSIIPFNFRQKLLERLQN